MRRPSRNIWITGWGTALSVLLFVSISLSGDKGPQIKFDGEVKDFGKIKQGEVLNHVFQFTNAGDSTLVINKVHTTCGCTAALVSEHKLEPGKKGEIKVSFNTRGYAGDVAKYIYVETNDPAHSTKQLTVKAAIDVPPRPIIELDQYSQDLGLLLEGEEIQTQVKVMNKGELELSVTFSHQDAEFFEKKERISPPLKIAAGKDKDVFIKIPKRQGQRLLREYVLFRSNDPMRPNLSLYLSGYVVTKKQLKELFDKYKDVLR